ncbi:hypothetical protein RH861_06370 [Agromyces indicus]|uniref:DUF559 domain-containing protein n=2 Tax=Agromyces indicus TaxID=758919 RepID=A0ABU1FJR1_9MICO|nr:hypothetical protein [Agromyces indicus]
MRQHAGVADDVRSRAMAYAERMPGRQVFSHATAAMLWGMPLPPHFEGDLRLHVGVPAGSTRSLAEGVVGHVVRPERLGAMSLAGVRLAGPSDAWCQLGSMLGVDDLVAAADFLITGGEPLNRDAALCTRGELTAALRRHSGCRGATRLREALELARWGPLSRRESLLRLQLTRGGLPEPVPNLRVLDATRRLVAIVDLAFPEWRVGIEYQGDLHRSPSRFRADVRRLERLADEGWLMVQATADDVGADGALRDSAAFVHRVVARLHSRGWCP